MATGISKAKARRSSKYKQTSISRAKAGLPAKAGKRRPHNIVKAKDGNYVAGAFVPREKVEKVEVKMFCMEYLVGPNDPRRVDFNKLK